MATVNSLRDKVISLDEEEFHQVALEVFQFQANNNLVYKEYIEYLGIDPRSVESIEQIPFIPIEFFKSRKVVSGRWNPKVVFTSSGTGSGDTSKHFLDDTLFYERISLRIFERLFGLPNKYHILALLPSYLERTGSSLVHMMNHLIIKSASNASGFYLKDYEKLFHHLIRLKNTDRKVMLWGVSFALLDFAEKYQLDLSEAIVIETGGMKGRREEIIRDDLHERLKTAFSCKEIQSEYGIAELTSQAYTAEGSFRTPPWMRLWIRDINDPFSYLTHGRVGGINIVDLANVHSCAFIETQDLGLIGPNGGFQVLGRVDNSDARGCNLMVYD